MKCFYHSADLDGHCSGAIVKLYAPHCEMWPIDYGDEFPWDKIRWNETIYMVDFSLEPFEDMIALHHSHHKLVWIDHHKSAIQEYEAWKFENPDKRHIAGIQTVGIGAALLTWNYCFPKLSPPFAVERIAEYDVWDHSNPDTLPFQYGARLYETDPSTPAGLQFWNDLFSRPSVRTPVATYEEVIEKGATCLAYQARLNAKICKNAFETQLDGLRAIAVNAPGCNSKTFEGIWNPERYDVILCFHLKKPGKWIVNMFTDKENLDLSIIAKKHGGGGHKQAAGFVCKALPF